MIHTCSLFSMEDAPLSLLKQYIQEWCDIYNTKESNKVSFKDRSRTMTSSSYFFIQTSIWKYDGYSSWYVTKEMEPRPLETVTLKAGLKEQIMQGMYKNRIHLLNILTKFCLPQT